MKSAFGELLEQREKRFYSFTTACLSLVDESNRINALLKATGNEQVSNLDNADFIVVTTCAVSKDSAQNSVRNILELNVIAKGKPIYVGGCLSNAKEREVLFRYANIKFFTADESFREINKINYPCEKTVVRCNPFWLDRMEKKIDKLNRLKKDNPKLAEFYAFTTDGIIFSKMPFEFDTLRISKGCDKQCTYCAIPNNRGRYIEHDFEYVKNQIDGSRARHLLFIGENIGMHRNFNKIMEYAISRKKIIMLRYLEPEWVGKIKPEYLKNIAYIGIPIQSASVKILQAMRRPKNIREIKEKFMEWNKNGIFTGTSIILSYPDENFLDYLKTLLFIAMTPLNYISFQNFSVRENSPCFKMYKEWNSHTIYRDFKFNLFNAIINLKTRSNYLKEKYRSRK
ncbi:MAG: radical SAM protein [archaeon]